MKAPLLTREAENSARTFFPFLLLFLLSAAIFVPFSKAETAEEEVGNVIIATIISTYFKLGYLGNEMEFGMGYLGPHTRPIEPFQDFCNDQTPTCNDLCKERLHLEMISQYTEVTYCRYIAKSQSQECWETQKMRCWAEGASVFDGAEEWIVKKHVKNADVVWTHFSGVRSPLVHYIIFGWGKFEQVDNICAKFAGSTQAVFQQLTNLTRDHTVIFGGHSSGSAWALCANFAWATAAPNVHRILISSGTVVPEGQFQNEYRRIKPWDTDFHLMNAVKFTDTLVVPDITPIEFFSDGMTMPQFGFTCTSRFSDSKIQCVEPQPKLNLIELMPKIADLDRFQRDRVILPDIHSFYTYAACWSACWDYFQSKGFNLSPNVFQYSKRFQNLQEVAQQAQGSVTAPMPSAGGASSSSSVLQPVTDSGVKQIFSSDLNEYGTFLHNPQDEIVDGGVIPSDSEQGEITPTHDLFD